MAAVAGLSADDLPAILTLSGALLAPVVGAIASWLTRSSPQRRLQETEYKKAQLDLIERSLTVGKLVSNMLGRSIDASAAEF